MKLLLIASLLMLLAGCGESHEAPRQTLPNDLRLVAGVTDAQIQAVYELRERFDYFIYGIPENDEAFFAADGSVAGFSAHVARWLSELFGIEFVPVIMESGDIADAIARRDVHFGGINMPTHQREPTLRMTSPIAKRAKIIVHRPGDDPTTIAAERTLSYVDNYADKHDADVIRDLLNSGAIDAYFGDGLLSLARAFPEFTVRPLYPFVFFPTIFAAGDPELFVIVDIVQLMLADGGMSRLGALHSRGLEDFRLNQINLMFTEDDWAFIADNPVINVAAACIAYPVSFYNDYENIHQGIGADILGRITDLTGLGFEMIDRRLPGASVIAELLNTREADMGIGLLSPDFFPHYYNLLWSDGFFTDNFALIGHSDLPAININEILYISVGVVYGTYETMFRHYFPGHINVHVFYELDELLEALYQGYVDTAFTNVGTLLGMTNFHERMGFWPNLVFGQTYDVRFAINPQMAPLLSIIDKVLPLIETDDIVNAWMNRAFDYNRLIIRAQREQYLAALTGLVIILGLLTALAARILSERKRLRNLVATRTDELLRASNAKTDFIANMSHEIRTPMNSIVGFSELAMEEEMSAKAGSFLERIVDNSKWLLQVINDILDISKIESGKIELEQLPFDLHEIFIKCESALMPKAVEKGIKIKFQTEYTPDDRLLIGDPFRLSQVLMNLLTNAVKFTERGYVQLLSVVKSVDGDQRSVYFEIKDSGIGMTKEQIQRVFEPFVQADTSITRRFGGTGLGLPIAKSLLENMDAELSIDSVPGVGSKFSFELMFNTLALDTKAPPIENTGPADDEKPMFSGQVLVCEDNEMNQMVIVEHLRRVGLDAAIAVNGQVGLEMVEARKLNNDPPFDLVLMDIHMPVMDGMEAASKIHALRTDTPIVAMTANIMAGDREMYRQRGMTDCVGKPFSSRELWACLQKYLQPVAHVKQTRPIHPAEAAPDPDEELKNKLIAIFLQENRNRFDEIRESIAHGDIVLAHRLAHSLKSSAGLIGKNRLQASAAAVETLLKGGENRTNETIMDKLNNELSAVIDELSGS